MQKRELSAQSIVGDLVRLKHSAKQNENIYIYANSIAQFFEGEQKSVCAESKLNEKKKTASEMRKIIKLKLSRVQKITV